MSKRIRVSKINIRISDEQEIAITLDQAKELHAALDEIFGEKTVDRIIERPYYLIWPSYTITCSGTNEKTGTITGNSTDNTCISPMVDWLPTINLAE